ncbi:MAG: TRAM domain-containing protein [Leptospiraceae bacterium]|nr:TRAM domain-containing protein [Leptospiraceae bacterium]
MTHVYKLLFALSFSIVSFGFLFPMYGDLLQPAIYTGLVFIAVLGIVYFEDKIFPVINAEVAFCVGIGLLVGFGIARLLVSLISESKNPGLGLIVYLALGYAGVKIGHAFSIKPGLAIFGGSGGAGLQPYIIGSDKPEEIRDKILDTSVVIDGRILDIADTHFIDGPLILPNFVLREIQLISDSSDPIKRARGRRGLDMLNKLQRKGTIEVKITYTDYTDTREVDAKLIKLARDTGAKLVTNDFNLNKVAELQGVKVLNLNNLANALKPVVLPGEEIAIQVIKEGKDENQGIGYLEDGTMVVIENGGHLVGKDVRVNVTSIIQTAAGKMIFTKAIK